MLSNFTYHIVQITSDSDSNAFEGIVEEAGVKGQKTFRSFDELKEIMNSNRQKREKVTRRPEGGL